MLKKSFLVLVSLSLIFLLSACKENITVPSVNESSSAQPDLISKSLSSFPEGRVKLDRVLNFESHWEVYIGMENGAIVKFHYTKSRELREVEGISGPFDYRLVIHSKAINYEDARKRALTAKSGSITSWKFEFDQSDNIYEYKFFISDNGDWEVKLNGVTGEILRVREK